MRVESQQSVAQAGGMSDDLSQRLYALEQKHQALAHDHGRELAALAARVEMLEKAVDRLEPRVSKHGEELGYHRAAHELLTTGLRDLRKLLDKLLVRRGRAPQSKSEDAPPPSPPVPPQTGKGQAI